MATAIEFVASKKRPKVQGTLVIGRKERLLADEVQAFVPKGAQEVWSAMVDRLVPGDGGGGTCTWLSGKPAHQVAVAALPEPCSRHNSPARPHALRNLVAARAPRKGSIRIFIALDRVEDALAAGCAVARAYPSYGSKTAKSSATSRTVFVSFISPAKGDGIDLAHIERVASSVREAAALVDQPASELHTDAFVDRAKALAEELGSDIKVIRGKSLQKQGFGGLWGVGKAATHPPALVVLSHRPKGAKRTVVWVGKGIVYDTGGLSLKTKGGMPGMKGDMGGAAAVMMAFAAAVRSKVKKRIHAVLCLAENSVGPEATRPDDILTMYSGKTVEVNNTDAEGRLVLADGVAYAVKKLKPDVIVDLATLTGAQLMATGRKHAGVMSNDEALERAAFEAGRLSGDLVHPLPYCPEFFRGEFKSKVADMKNSVKDRMNAQSSCAGQFVGAHLGTYDGGWLHVDMAGPSTSKERGTGYGVALLMTMFGDGA